MYLNILFNIVPTVVAFYHLMKISNCFVFNKSIYYFITYFIDKYIIAHIIAILITTDIKWYTESDFIGKSPIFIPPFDKSKSNLNDDFIKHYMTN